MPLQLVDLDGAGKLDILSSGIQASIWNGRPVFPPSSSPDTVYVNPLASTLCSPICMLGDVTGDGRLDFIGGNWNLTVDGQPQAGTIWIFDGTHTGMPPPAGMLRLLSPAAYDGLGY